MRIVGVLGPYQVVHRSRPHDLLIRGPFSDGSGKRRFVNRVVRTANRFLAREQPVRLHVSSENPFSEHYQDFGQSGCDFGLGHEIRHGDVRYQRMPHWWNYVDFAAQGVPSPDHWVRLGEPLNQGQLLRPLKWNRNAQPRAALVTSYLNSQRRFLMDQVSKVLPVDGFGRAFDASISDHTRSGFTKRQLLTGYQFSLCPENAIAPGYYTEKVPESFACGTIPIAYLDQYSSIDFDPKAFLNLYDYLDEGMALGLEKDLSSERRMDELLSTPLLKGEIDLDQLIEFIKNVLDCAKSF